MTRHARFRDIVTLAIFVALLMSSGAGSVSAARSYVSSSSSQASGTPTIIGRPLTDLLLGFPRSHS